MNSGCTVKWLKIQAAWPLIRLIKVLRGGGPPPPAIWQMRLIFFFQCVSLDHCQQGSPDMLHNKLVHKCSQESLLI